MSGTDQVSAGKFTSTYALGKRHGREEVLEEIRRLLGLGACPHCAHREREHD